MPVSDILHLKMKSQNRSLRIRKVKEPSQKNKRFTKPLKSKNTFPYLKQLDGVNPFPKAKKLTIENLAWRCYLYRRWLTIGLAKLAACLYKLKGPLPRDQPHIAGRDVGGARKERRNLSHEDQEKMLIKAKVFNENDSETMYVIGGKSPLILRVKCLQYTKNGERKNRHRLDKVSKDCIYNPMFSSVNHPRGDRVQNGSSSTNSKPVRVRDLELGNAPTNTFRFDLELPRKDPAPPSRGKSVDNPQPPSVTSVDAIPRDNDLQKCLNLLRSPRLLTTPSKQIVPFVHSPVFASPCLTTTHRGGVFSPNRLQIIPVSPWNTYTPPVFSPSIISIKQVLAV